MRSRYSLRFAYKAGKAGYILVPMVVLAAGMAVALFALAFRPGKKLRLMGIMVQKRLEAIESAMTGYYMEHSSFPGTLASLMGRGRISLDSIRDPYNKRGFLQMTAISSSPDKVAVFSAGPNGTYENGGGDDVSIRISGAYIGAIVTRDRLRALKRGIKKKLSGSIGKTAESASSDSSSLENVNSTESLITFNQVMQQLGLPAKFAKDGWGTDFSVFKAYKSETTSISAVESPYSWELRSAGPDRKMNTEDDIVFSW